MRLSFNMVTFCAAAAVCISSVTQPLAVAVFVGGLKCSANSAYAVNIVVLMRCATFIVIRRSIKQHLVAIRAEYWMRILSDFLTEGIAELVCCFSACECILGQTDVVFNRFVFLCGQVIAVFKNICILIYAAERVCFSARSDYHAHIIAVCHSALCAVGVVEVCAYATRPASCRNTAKVIAVYGSVRRILGYDAASKAACLYFSGIIACFHSHAAVVSEYTCCIYFCFNATVVYAANNMHVTA